VSPKEQISAEQIFDVAIVGYGPTGATLANLLALRGHHVLIIEREAELYNLPRAVHFDDETMRVFQMVGIADELCKLVYVNPGMKFQDNNGNVLLDWPRDQNITAHGWNASYRLHQPDLEKLLRQKIKAATNVHEALACEVEAIKEKPGHAEIYCNNKNFEARFVVGCDGANSLVRKFIGTDMIDFGFCQRWLVVDVILNKPRPDLGDHSIQFCDTKRPMTYCRSPGLRRRWEITILDDDNETEISAEKNVWELLARWIKPQDARLERSAVYTFHSSIARQWQKGRLLIAGDAAHLTPPFMGQGMCTGIRDAANLAWKLTECLQQPETQQSEIHAKLASYQTERSPHAQTYIETAVQLGGLINSMDRERALQLSEDQSKTNESNTAKNSNEKNNKDTTIRSIQPKLGASPWLHSIGEQPGHSAGRPFAQVMLKSGTVRFDDLVGYKHALITRRKLKNPAPDTFVALSAEEHPSLDDELDKLNADAVWIRPDRYIAELSSSPEELFKLIPYIQ